MRINIRTKNGFTLTELLIILGIIVILISISIPLINNIRPQLILSGAVRDLITNIRYAQQLAVTEQADHGVYFSTTTEDKYQIIRHKNGADSVVKEKLLPDGINFQQITPLTSNEIRFNPYGAVDEDGEITLINNNGATTTVRISSSGFVKTLD